MTAAENDMYNTVAALKIHYIIQRNFSDFLVKCELIENFRFSNPLARLLIVAAEQFLL